MPTPAACLEFSFSEHLPWAWALAPRHADGLPPAEMLISRVVSKPDDPDEGSLQLGVTKVGLDPRCVDIQRQDHGHA